MVGGIIPLLGLFLVSNEAASLGAVGFEVLLVKVAETDVAILTARDEACPVGGEREAVDGTEMSLDLPDLRLQDQVVEHGLELRLVHSSRRNLTRLLTSSKDNLVLKRGNLFKK